MKEIKEMNLNYMNGMIEMNDMNEMNEMNKECNHKNKACLGSHAGVIFDFYFDCYLAWQIYFGYKYGSYFNLICNNIM